MLYLLREVYDLKVMTFTKDGGFLPRMQAAHRRVGGVFDVPHIYVNDALAPELSGAFMKQRATSAPM